MLKARGEEGAIGAVLFAWKALSPSGMKPRWLYGTGAMVEPDSCFLYGDDTWAALAT